jgi:hypothetical protein
MQKTAILSFVLAAAAVLVGCSGTETKPIAGNASSSANLAAAPAQGPAQPAANANTAGSKPLYTASNSITAADLAKAKWLTGSFEGKGADKPFYNKYGWSGTTLNIASYEDEAMTQQNEKASFVLKDGMFANPDGDPRFAASEITEDHIQFVTLSPGKSEAFRMERKPDGTVAAVLEWTGPEGNPTSKTYILEPLKK